MAPDVTRSPLAMATTRYWLRQTRLMIPTTEAVAKTAWTTRPRPSALRSTFGNGSADGLDIGHDLIASFEEVITGSGDDHIVAGSSSVSMTGGDGNDTFEFQREEDDHEAMTVRKITDFTVGDRIVAATYEISFLEEDGLQDALSDMFDDIYLSADGDKRPVRFRFEKVDGDELTLVDVHDRPESDDFYTIELVGHHHLQFTSRGRGCLRQSGKSGHETLRSERVRSRTHRHPVPLTPWNGPSGCGRGCWLVWPSSFCW